MVNKCVRALGLSSGGLDSILAALILKNQGIDVTWITFKTPFFSPKPAILASKQNNIPIRVEEITDIYMEMLKNPQAGYGKNMNPCMDCHTLMFSQAGVIMEKEGFDFLFSGEVAGQRPMSQTKNSMNYVAKNSGFKGHILRPLSARLFPETPMENEGLVDREKLLDISGRSRKVQIALAKEMGVTRYPAPAGGCLLTDKGFSKKLRDLMYVQKIYDTRDLYLLSHGRHLRLAPDTRIVVGRTQAENQEISKLYDPAKDIRLRHARLAGPLTIMPGGGSEKMVRLAASICAGYTKADPGLPTQVVVQFQEKEEILTVPVLKPADLKDFISYL
ncbi:MAG: tRNA 4-thiouridine(8) synthase ThiI [Desulfobacterium sp.]